VKKRAEERKIQKSEEKKRLKILSEGLKKDM